eukprot:scaffold165116_cov26-Tisochrysis_lutea.AAC.1
MRTTFLLAVGTALASALLCPSNPRVGMEHAVSRTYYPRLLPAVPTRRANVVATEKSSHSFSSANSGKLALAALALCAAPMFLDPPAAGAAGISESLSSMPSALLGDLLFAPGDGSPPTPEETLIFDAIAFIGGPLTLFGGAFFRVVNGAERPGFEKDPIVQFLGGPDVVRAGKARIREEGFIALFDPNLFRR